MININDKEFNEFTSFIKQKYGINLEQKKNLIEGRLSNIIAEKQYGSFSEYFNAVINDRTGKEATILVNKLTTNHTFFMRESNHFDFFREHVLPYFISHLNERDLRIWSAGCSSGEEPYTLAMLLADYLSEQKAFWDTKILATDISVKVLEEGEKGIYSKDVLDKLPPLWKFNYFTKIDDEKYRISDKIRDEVIFRVFNLMDEVFPFKRKFHTIFCRNVMIYFDNDTKMNLIRKFYDFTEPGGYLFIGHSESIPREATGYKYIMPAVYRKELI